MEVMREARSRDSSVGIATGYGLDCPGSIPGRGKRFFSTASRSALGPILWVPVAAISPGVKWPRHEADHPFPSSVDAKNAGAIRTIPIRLRGVVLI
jgi:hypothetical protein